jgi:hypothetical protein
LATTLEHRATTTLDKGPNTLLVGPVTRDAASGRAGAAMAAMAAAVAAMAAACQAHPAGAAGVAASAAEAAAAAAVGVSLSMPAWATVLLLGLVVVVVGRCQRAGGAHTLRAGGQAATAALI